MSKLDTLRQSPVPSGGEKNPALASSLAALRAEARHRLRRETISTVMACAVMAALVVLAVTGSLPALRGSMFSSAFVGGFLAGLFAVVATLSVRQVMGLRGALADDRELRRYFARENDELTAHMEREIARTFVQTIPLLAVVAIFVGALVSFEAMIAVAATLVFLATALLVVKLSYRARYRAGAEGEAEAD